MPRDIIREGVLPCAHDRNLNKDSRIHCSHLPIFWSFLVYNKTRIDRGVTRSEKSVPICRIYERRLSER